jgi:hypothetical protein
MFGRCHSFCNEVLFSLRENVWGNWTVSTRELVLKSSPEEIALYRWALETIVPQEVRLAATRVVDVGCRDWSYVEALAQAFPHASLTGIEVDARRRYWNLRRRMDHAQAYTRAVQNQGRDCRCLFKDFRAVEEGEFAGEGALTVFCFLFPFVSENPCLKGGLPAPYSHFEEVLKSAQKLANRPSFFVSLHQGDWERDVAQAAYDKVSLESKNLELSIEEVSQFSVFPYELQAFISKS